MSSLIEQAARRLEQLRQAGVVIPDAVDTMSPPQAPPPAPKEAVSSRFDNRMERQAFATPPGVTSRPF